MKLFHALAKPYYVYRPLQVWRRLSYEFQKPSRPSRVKLPWGLQMLASPEDDLGYALLTAGINDLTVSECLFRLADPGDLAVDVGANVGYTTGILGTRVGATGQVVSFEPHPALFEELRTNLARWKSQHREFADVHAVNRAVSDRIGEATLYEPATFQANKGRSMLNARHQNGEESREITVITTMLDEQFSQGEKIGMLKIDVEGHEEKVLAGAKRLLSEGQVRDVLLEEYAPYPAATHRRLEEAGFQLFAVHEGFKGPTLLSPSAGWVPPVDSPTNYVATRDTKRLQQRLAPRGWKCLYGKA